MVHCGAIPDNLLESELFGYEKVLYRRGPSACGTDPIRRAAAPYSSMRITEMSTALQNKLLRFMGTARVRRIGSHDVRHVAVRVVAAANKILMKKLPQAGSRLDFCIASSLRLLIPPLRAPVGHSFAEVETMLKKLAARCAGFPGGYGNPRQAMTGPAMLRELENVCERRSRRSWSFCRKICRTGSGPGRSVRTQAGPPGMDASEEAEKRNRLFQTLKKTEVESVQSRRDSGIDR